MCLHGLRTMRHAALERLNAASARGHGSRTVEYVTQTPFSGIFDGNCLIFPYIPDLPVSLTSHHGTHPARLQSILSGGKNGLNQTSSAASCDSERNLDLLRFSAGRSPIARSCRTMGGFREER